uniref:DNA methyltransferase 1-associated protein 1 n=1 Tax=Cacopsylla melanoneura TaxID=428564 RepID=A0A8D9DTN3_9HEMI
MTSDIRDILELEKDAPAEITREAIIGVDKTRKMQPNKYKKEKRPEGMAREVFALLCNDNRDAPPLLPTDSGQGYKHVKAKLGMRKVRQWKWLPFSNPARKDNAVFHHWRRVTDEGKEYPFARFNKQVSIPTYTDTEYLQELQSPTWTRAETDHLFDLCHRFDLRFIVIHDRYDTNKFPTGRSIEDLKQRYYFVCHTLAKMRGTESSAGSEPKLFDAEHEKKRKEQLKRLFERTPEQVDEEQMLLAELKKIEIRRKERDRKTQDLQKLMTAADLNTDNRKQEKKLAHQIPRRSLDTTQTLESAGIKWPEMRATGVSIRSQKMKLPTGLGQKKIKALEQMLQDLNISLNPVPTEEIVTQYNDLRSDMVLLYELKQALDNYQFELQSLKHQFEAMHPGETFKIPDKMFETGALLSNLGAGGAGGAGPKLQGGGASTENIDVIGVTP